MLLIPSRVIGWFETLRKDADASRELTTSLREELATVRAERDAIAVQLALTRNSFEWLITRVNALELERTSLIERAYHIKLPAAPEIVQTSNQVDMRDYNFSFEDLGDDDAKKLGLPLHGGTQ